MALSFSVAAEPDVPALASLRSAVAEGLTHEHGRGHWSSAVSERGVLYSMRIARVLVARERGTIVATLTLATRKPWAIDVSYFTPVRKPLYLIDMAVAPAKQRRGLGRRFLLEAARMAREWPAQAIRLDAYDSVAGAGGFYAKCGYREVGRTVYRGTPLIYYELVLPDA